MNEQEICANSIKLLQFKSLVNFRNKYLGINEDILPLKYDAYDAANEGLSTEIFERNILPEVRDIKTTDIKTTDTTDNVGKESQSAIILQLCDDLEFFHDAAKEAYCKFGETDKHRTYAISSSDFAHKLRAQFYKKHKKSINSNSMTEAIETLKSKALFDGQCRKISTRVCRIDNIIYIDLCNDNNEFVAITPSGHEIINNPPAYFVRKNGMTQLPRPEPGGSLIMFKKHFGAALNDNGFKLLIGWILGTLRGGAPYPILIIIGEQGSGKSTLTKVLRMLIDPSDALLSYTNNDNRDLAISANSSHLICIDNVSKLTQEKSDLMCMISTGGNFKTRKLFTNGDEHVVKLANPQIINGISCIPQFPDLLERSLMIEMNPISADVRKTDSQIMSDFMDDYPKMFGYLCEVLSNAQNNIQQVSLLKMPRMADFCVFVTAAEDKLGWDNNSFFMAMEQNQNDLSDLSIDDCTFVDALKLFIDHIHNHKWIGTIADLLRDMTKHFGNDHIFIRASDWPKSPQGAGKILSRFIPPLKRCGYIVQKYRDTTMSRTRIVEIHNQHS